MELKTKKQLTSLALTFLSTFLATIAVGFENVNAETIELSVVGAVLVTGLRAGLKSIFLYIASDGS